MRTAFQGVGECRDEETGGRCEEDQGHRRMSPSPCQHCHPERQHTGRGSPMMCMMCVIHADHGNSQRYQHQHVTPSPAMLQILHLISCGPRTFFSVCHTPFLFKLKLTLYSLMEYSEHRAKTSLPFADIRPTVES